MNEWGARRTTHGGAGTVEGKLLPGASAVVLVVVVSLVTSSAWLRDAATVVAVLVRVAVGVGVFVGVPGASLERLS